MVRNLTIKSIGIFMGFWLIWNFAWIVSFFTLMNNSSGHYMDSIAPALFIWIGGALLGSILLYYYVNSIEIKYQNIRNLSNSELKEVTKKAVNIQYTASFIYAIIWIISTLILFLVLKSNYGNLAANSIWVGGIAGFLACPLMIFGAVPLLFINVNRSFSNELNNRGLSVNGIYMNIRNKLLIVFGASIAGLIIWIGGFAYYTGINQMIEEIKISRQLYQKIIAQNIMANTEKNNNKEAILAQLEKNQLPKNESLILFDTHGNILSQMPNKNFEKKQAIGKVLKDLTAHNKSGSEYDNTNENVLVYSPLNDNLNLALAINISKNTNRLTEFLYWFVVFLVVGIFVAFTNSMALSAWLSKTIKHLEFLFEKLAKNDFSEIASKDSEDELGNIAIKYNIFIVEVRKLISSIQTAAQSLLSASQEIASNNQALTQRTSSQASSVEELSAILEQMSSSITQNTGNTKQTEEIALESLNSINLSNQSVTETIKAMRDITGKAMLIIDIAKNTNILAVNAAIEAARAGQLGKGFAVVASEVKALAENTKEASEQIDSLTRSGIELAEKSGKLLAQTVEQMKKTSDLVQHINGASMEQDAGVEQINMTVEQLHRIAQENASTSEETAASSEELTAQANELFALVSGFKI